MLGSPVSRNTNIDGFQNTAVNVVDAVCSTVARPIELILRPTHGTRYFTVPVVFLSTMLMIFLPALSAVTEDLEHMLPFTNFHAAVGLFGIGSLSKLYFFLSFVHGIRLWRLMIYMEKEKISTFEGPPLFFFHLLPKSNSFWFTRIVLEPAAVLIAATVLGRLFIFQSGLTTYLQIGALMLSMKELIEFHRAWEYLRQVMDSGNLAPIIASMVENRATQEDLAKAHLASFPANTSPDMRRWVVGHFARVYTPEGMNHTDPNETRPKP
jgi:hypothetical protein